MGRNDKITTPNKDSAYDASPLNDESWETFLYILLPDSNKPKDQPSNTKQNLNIRWNQLYDIIGNGYRQRFTILEKSELLNWVTDNQKNYDLCKEAKACIDNPAEEMTDLMIARLIRLWLLIQKQDGVEGKLAAKPPKENTDIYSLSIDEAAIDHKKTILGKKDDRAKSPAVLPKKPTSGAIPIKNVGSPKSTEVVRPPSNSDSKRKVKLRERGANGKNNEKTQQSVDDEPEDGPDVYCLLKDFENSAVINLLLEECDIQINCIITLAETNQNIDVSTYTPYQTLKDVYNKASDNSLWRNVVWSVLENCGNQDPRDLFDKISGKTYYNLNQKRAYEIFYRNCPILNVPELDFSGAKRFDLRFYDNILNSISNQKAITEDVIIGTAIEQVARILALEEITSDIVDSSAIQSNESGMLQLWFNKAIKNLSTSLGENSEKPGEISNLDPKNDLDIIQSDDINSFSIKECETFSCFGIKSEDMIKNLISKFPMRNYQSIVPLVMQNGIKDLEASNREKTLLKSEFQRFSKLNDKTIQRALIQLEFENMFREKFNSHFELDAWCWIENYDKDTLTQILQNAKVENPSIYTKFCAREGTLLLAMIGQGKPGIIQSQEVKDFAVKTKVGFGLFHKLSEKESHYLNPPNASSTIYSAGDRLMNFEEEDVFMYPDTGAKIGIKKSKMGNDASTLCTFSHPEIFLSWRLAQKDNKNPYFTCSLPDGTIFTISKSNEGSFIYNVSTSDGLLVEFLSNLKIGQRHAIGAPSLRNNSQVEVSRIICEDGSIIKFFDDDLQQVLLPNSGVLTKKKNKNWSSISPNGVKVTIDSQLACTTERLKILAENYIDSKKRVFEREDLTFINAEYSGATSIDHHDGTKVYLIPTIKKISSSKVITTQTSQNSILETPAVMKPEDSVSESNPPSRPKTASFQNIDDIKLRDSVSPISPPKFEIPASYSCKVEKKGYATVINENSTNKVLLPNGISIIRGTKEKETFIFLQTSNLCIEIDTLGNTIVNRISTESSHLCHSLIKLNWLDGSFKVTDNSITEYSCDKMGETNVKTSKNDEFEDKSAANTSLQQEVNLKTLIARGLNSTPKFKGNIPKLFILREDGTGSQLFRDDQLTSFFKSKLNDSKTEVTEQTLPDTNALSVMVLSPCTVSGQAHNAILYRQLNRYPPLDYDTRRIILSDLEKYSSWKKSQQLNSDKYLITELNQDKLSIGTSVARSFTLGCDKSETEEYISKKYFMYDGKVTPISKNPSLNIAKKNNEGWIKPRIIKKRKNASTLPQLAGVVSLHEKIIKHSSDIPKYFESPEGLYTLTRMLEHAHDSSDLIASASALNKSNPGSVQELKSNQNILQEDSTIESKNQNETEPNKLNSNLDLNNINGEQILKSTIENTDLETKNILEPKISEPLVEIEKMQSNTSEKNTLDKVPELPKLTLLKNNESAVQNHMKVDVFGNIRKEKINLPSFTRLSKPGAEPNESFLKIEADTRRTLKTTSTAKMSQSIATYALGTFEILPSNCRFGIVKEGFMYKTLVSMINVGIDSSRFRIKPAKCSRLNFKYKKGTVAPGITILISVELDAKLIEGDMEKIEDQIEIITELQILHVPITAVIKKAHLAIQNIIRPNVEIIKEAAN